VNVRNGQGVKGTGMDSKRLAVGFLFVLWCASSVGADSISKHLRPGATARPVPITTGEVSARQEGEGYQLTYSGSDATIVYTVTPSSGVFAISGRYNGKLFDPCAGGTVAGVAGTLSGTPKLDGTTLSCRFSDGAYSVVYQLEQKTLVLTLTGALADIIPGDFSNATAASRSIFLPHSGKFGVVVTTFDAETVFATSFFDFAFTRAAGALNMTELTREPAATASYAPRTHKSSTQERLYITVSPDIHEVLPDVPFKTGAGVAELTSKIVYDQWDGHPAWLGRGGSFDDAVGFLQKLKQYRCDEILYVRHNWQRDGYDTNLPHVLPPNEGMGGSEGMKRLATFCTENGYLFGLHTNYCLENVVSGQMVEVAQPIETQIHTDYNTDCDFQDVVTAVIPWSNGIYQDSIALIDAMREIHGGPVMSEGGHGSTMVYAGIIDAVASELGEFNRNSEPATAGEQPTPFVGRFSTGLYLDFDLLKIRPRTILQSVGYESRFFKANLSDVCLGGCQVNMTEEQHDIARAFKIAFAHSGGINQMYRVIETEEFVKEYYVMQQLQTRYLGPSMSPTRIEYRNGSGKFVTLEEAIANGYEFKDGSIQFHTVWDNGLEIYSNLRPDSLDLTVGGVELELPQYGWAAWQSGRPRDFLCYSAMDAGSRADYVQSPAYDFIDGRGVKHGLGALETDGAVIMIPGDQRVDLIPIAPGGSVKPATRLAIRVTDCSTCDIGEISVRGLDASGAETGVVAHTLDREYIRIDDAELGKHFAFRILLEPDGAGAGDRQFSATE